MSTFSERLKQLRAENEMSQTQLGALIHVERSTIAGYESRNKIPCLPTLIAIADVFDISLDDLAGRTYPKKKDNK